MPSPPRLPGVEITKWCDSYASVLTEQALEVLATVERRFAKRRRELLEDRVMRAAELASGHTPDFLAHSAVIRDSAWFVASPPADLIDRRVETTGPTDRDIAINLEHAPGLRRRTSPHRCREGHLHHG